MRAGGLWPGSLADGEREVGIGVGVGHHAQVPAQGTSLLVWVIRQKHLDAW